MKKAKLLYFYDPLCGWCYGFSPVIKNLEEEYKETIQFEAISGGMVLGDRVKPLSEMKDYLKEAMPRLEEMTGVKFGEPYLKVLEEGSLILDSELPCIAMTVFKSMTNKSNIQFASTLQSTLYDKGISLNEVENYQSMAEKFDLPWEVFKAKLEDSTYKEKTYQEFQLGQQSGINGFPSVVLMVENQAYLIARGFRPENELKNVIEEILKKEEHTS
ncbi:DsbA family protein [Marivirga arenosa]|uniref:DsbA family protein n=1 Tax=Marivirga arenosa TaxID=3059076 RepID=A0AA51ZVS4_9BACT|nr:MULTISPECIES: DsbA family protein [unclassified Marivirga]WMN05976.1 DsbA family protein [Marivirga sp. ABR2-2]WNB17658.1 DsbA family protein [Marivirga sp. BKB1-2]